MAEPGPGRFTVRVLANSVTPYLRVGLVLADDRVGAAWWSTLLGIIPLRRRHLTVPLDRLLSLELRGTAFPDRLAAAGAGALVLFLARLPVWGAALVGLSAVIFLFLGYQDALHLSHLDGRVVIPVCWWQRGRVSRFVAAVQAGRRSRGEV